MLKLGQRVQQLRNIHGYSDQQVAEYLDMDINDYRKIEKGQGKGIYKLSHVRKMCNLYNCTYEYLMCKSDKLE